MKLLSSLVAVAAMAPAAHAAPTPTCLSQDPCISFTVEKMSAENCAVGGDCPVEVCMVVNGEAGGCGKGNSTFSHMCMQAGSDGCTLWDGADPALGMGSGTTCADSGEGTSLPFTGKCSAKNVKMCQEGAPGTTLYWQLKDGDDTSTEAVGSYITPKSFVTTGGDTCSVQVSCFNKQYVCGGNTNNPNVNKERTWAFRIPDVSECDVCKDKPSTPPLTPSDPPPSTPTDDTSGSRGDPHFKTWVGEHFEFHGQCDLVLAKDPEFANGLGLDVQIRTKLVRYWSYIKRAAIRIGDDILEVEGTADLAETKPLYWFNFGVQPEIKTIGGFPVDIVIGKANSRKHHFIIDLSSKYPGVKIAISTMKEFVKVDFVNSSAEAFGNTVGMMGDFKSGKTLGRDRATEINDFNALGNEWQLQPADTMLFHDVSDPQFPKRCVLPEDPQGQRRRRLEESSVSVEDAEKACSKLTDDLDRKECVYDIIATQDMDMAGAY